MIATKKDIIEKKYYPINLRMLFLVCCSLMIIWWVIFGNMFLSIITKLAFIAMAMVVLFSAFSATLYFRTDRVTLPFIFRKGFNSYKYADITTIAIRKETHYHLHGFAVVSSIILNNDTAINLSIFTMTQQVSLVKYLISKCSTTVIVDQSIYKFIEVAEEKNLWKSFMNSFKDI